MDFYDCIFAHPVMAPNFWKCKLCKQQNNQTFDVLRFKIHMQGPTKNDTSQMCMGRLVGVVRLLQIVRWYCWKENEDKGTEVRCMKIQPSASACLKFAMWHEYISSCLSTLAQQSALLWASTVWRLQSFLIATTICRNHSSSNGWTIFYY